jgi:DNA mismatch endonuclease (patch repair protein)
MDRSQNMRRIRSTDSGPEMTVRRLLHHSGYRYRLHRRDLPGTPDLVFPGRRKVIFVHGCFWHAHGCARSHSPRSHQDYWDAKLARNVARYSNVVEQLAVMGWTPWVVWECQTTKRDELLHQLRRWLDGP